MSEIAFVAHPRLLSGAAQSGLRASPAEHPAAAEARIIEFARADVSVIIVTEDLVFMLDSMGLKTGIDLDKLLQVRDIVIAALPGEDMYGFTPDAGLPKGYGEDGKAGWGIAA